MYREKDVQQNVEDFILSFDGTLSADNSGVIKAGLIPWDDIVGDYSDLFPSDTCNVAKSAQVAFGSLVIKETLGLNDEETVEQIRGNHYLQYSLRKQLGYLRRNLVSIGHLKECCHESPLTESQGLTLQNIKEIYRRLKCMYDDHKTHSVPNRIVSINQPHFRPITRGKAQTNVKFGAKLTISIVDDFAYMEKLSWDNFNEAMTL